ncbi:tol-pal system protein YbgF [Castellaniella sp. WN]
MTASTHRLHALSAAALLALALAAPAAQAFADDEARRAILELRTQIKQMNEQNQQARLQLADQMDLLHQEIATLRGRVEELSQRTPAADGNAPQTPQAGDPQEQAAYEAAADQYRNGRYKEAAAGFATFIQSYPDSALAGDALFYLGSSQYASKDFKNSIQTMQTLVKNHPDDPRAPDALLVVAADQIELNDMKGAKTSLQRIIKDYPGSAAAETAKSRLKLL